jgi:hypothetical protein
MRGSLEPRRVRSQPPPGPTRAERRAAQTRRSRPLQLIAVLAVVILLVAAAFVFFFRDSDDEPNVTLSDDSVSANLELTLGGTANVNAGPEVQLAPDQANLIMEAVGQYVDGGLIEPLRTGDEVGDEVVALFDAGAQTRLAAGERALVFEEGVPQLDDDLVASATPVILTALSDGDGTFQLVTALFNYYATVPTGEGTFDIARSTELVFINEAGTWKVTGYDVTLSRTPTAATTTTGAAE